MNKPTKKQVYSAGKLVLNIVGWFCLVALTILSVYSVYNTVTNTNGLNMIGKTSVAVVLSGSMGEYPATGDLVVIKAQDEYFVDDIITFTQNGVTVTHRIIAINGDIIMTQGDANNTADEPISVSAVYGKVVCVIPKLGYVISAAQQPSFIAAFISLIMFIGVVFYMIEEYKKYKKGTVSPKEDTQIAENVVSADDIQREIDAIKEELNKIKTSSDKDDDLDLNK